MQRISGACQQLSSGSRPELHSGTLSSAHCQTSACDGPDAHSASDRTSAALPRLLLRVQCRLHTQHDPEADVPCHCTSNRRSTLTTANCSEQCHAGSRRVAFSAALAAPCRACLVEPHNNLVRNLMSSLLLDRRPTWQRRGGRGSACSSWRTRRQVPDSSQLVIANR